MIREKKQRETNIGKNKTTQPIDNLPIASLFLMNKRVCFFFPNAIMVTFSYLSSQMTLEHANLVIK